MDTGLEQILLVPLCFGFHQLAHTTDLIPNICAIVAPVHKVVRFGKRLCTQVSLSSQLYAHTRKNILPRTHTKK